MPSPGKLLVVASLAVLGGVIVSSLEGDDTMATTESAELMVNRIWIARMPTDERDMVPYFVAVERSGGRIGVLGTSSGWRDHSDLFLWALEGDRLSLYMGQQKQRLALRAEARHCDDPEGFELCLTLTGSGRKIALFSFEDWVVDPDDDEIPEALRELAPQLADGVEDMLSIDAESRSREPWGGAVVEALPWRE